MASDVVETAMHCWLLLKLLLNCNWLMSQRPAS